MEVMPRLSIAQFIRTSAGTGVALLVALAGCDAPQNAIGTHVRVTGGMIRGEVSADSAVYTYRGIPFAAPPVGDLRWSPPQPVEPWDAIRDATAPGPRCLQRVAPSEPVATRDPIEDEDCLTLNVWTAAASAGERRPVMVWIHGGGFAGGTGATRDGTELARRGAVVVTINYRLGAFGFFAHPELSAENPSGVSGNQGFLDQIQALRWVRDNIEGFGGDPDRVTIFGVSAGSVAVGALMGSPLAAGLFHRAIGESGSMLAHRLPLRSSHERVLSAEGLGIALAQALAVEGVGALDSLRALSTEHVRAAWNANPYTASHFNFLAIDGHVLPAALPELFATGRFNDVPLIIGSTADEGTFLTPSMASTGIGSTATYERWVRDRLRGRADRALELYPAASETEARGALNDLFTDGNFTALMQFWAESKSGGSAPTYMYFFSRVPPGNLAALGAYHGAEVTYVFGDDVAPGGAALTDVDHALSDAMSGAWVRFAATGDPNGGTLPEWRPYEGPNGAYVEFGDEIRAATALRAEKMEFWRAHFTAGGFPPREGVN